MGLIKGKTPNNDRRLKRRQTILKKANAKNFVRGVEDMQQYAWVDNSINSDLSCDLDQETNQESHSIGKLSKQIFEPGTGELGLSDKYTLQGQFDNSSDPNVQILIVEDNTYSAYALMSILEQYQFQFQHVTDGQQAVNCVKKRYQKLKQTFKLIVTDLYMPDLNGFEATQQIRQFLKDQPSSVEQPYICLLTQNNTSACKKQSATFGCDDVIVKPIFKAGVQRLLLKAGLILK